MESCTKQKFIISFFAELEKERKYCILRNYERLPEHVGDDIDILVQGEDKEVVNNIIIPLIGRLGWQYVIKYEKKGFTPIVCFHTDDETVDTLQLDIYTKFIWRGNRFINEDAILKSAFKYNDYWVASKGADVATTVMKELLGSGFVRKKYTQKIPSYITDIEEQENYITCFENIDEDLGILTREACLSGDLSNINKLAKVAKQKIKKGNKVLYYKESAIACLDRVKKMLKPEGKLVVFVGPDGSGKTTLISNIDIYLERFFPHNSKIYHRRYEIFPELRTGHGLSSMKGKITSGKSNRDENFKTKGKVNRSLISKLAAWFVVMYYTLEYMVGSIMCRILLQKRTLVLYDRYYYDHFVQPATRDLIWPARKLLLAFVKKPDVIIHLIASGETIYKRKQDLNAAEIDIQNQYMTKILCECKNVVDISSEERNANQVAADVFRVIVNKLYF